MKKLSLIPFINNPSGTVSVPGSKSLTNRALFLAALADGKSVLTGCLESDDSEVMQKALQKLGVSVKKKEKEWEIYGLGGRFTSGNHNIYLGNAGTAVRFLTAGCGFVEGNIRIYGKQRMHERPIGDLLLALRQIGVLLFSEKENGCPPVIISGIGKIEGGSCEISGASSSQFISALLQIGPLTQKGIRVTILPPLMSRPYLQMTIGLLKEFGVMVEEISEYEFFVSPQKISPTQYYVEGDASSAAHVFSLAMAKGGEVTISNFPQKSLQGDTKFLEVIKTMGGEISFSQKGATLRRKKPLQPLGEIDLKNIPDAAMVVVVLCALAEGYSKITGLSTLRKKECDRIEALVGNLKKMGADVFAGEDFIEIQGDSKNLHGAEIETYDDHRVAMSFAALGTVIPGVIILDPKCVEKTFPNFWEVMEKLRN